MWPAAMLVSLAMAGAPPAPDTPCVPISPKPPKPKVSPFEQQVRDGMQVRRAYGMRADRAWVIRVIRSPRSRVDLGFGPASPRELRYLRLRDKVIEATDVIGGYLRREKLDVDGGYDVEDDEQGGGPFLTYKLSGERARLEPELRSRFPYPRHLRFADVEYSLRQLKAVANRVFDDSEALAREGFFLDNGGPDSETNRAEIGLITERTDAAEYFAARYGPAVAVEVIGTETSELVCTRPEAYRAARGGRSLLLAWTTNSVYTFERIEVDETRRTVRIGIVERAPTGSLTLAGQGHRRRVRLERPLGDRRVVYARSGRPILRCEPGTRPRDLRKRLSCRQLGITR